MFQAPCKSGIYMIRNTKTGRCYIGSAVDMKKREALHWHKLRRGEHHSRHLQASFSKHGREAFTFFPLAFIPDKDRLIEVEQLYIDSHMAADDRYGYNICKKAGSRLGTKMTAHAIEAVRRASTGRKQSPETIEKRMSQIRGRPCVGNIGKKHTRESIEKRVSQIRGKTGPNLGKKMSAESSAKKSASLTGRKMSPESVEKSRAAKIGKPRPDISQWAPEKFSMFSVEQVLEIRKARKAGDTYKLLQEKFGGSIATLHAAVNGRSAHYSKVTNNV